MLKKELNSQDSGRIRQICEDAGIKLTHQRLEIFKELLSGPKHPSAEQVHSRLQERMPTIALDTVYRTLTTFDELGIINKLHIGNERTLFDTNVNPHHHFVCSRCRKVEDIYWQDFDEAALPKDIRHIGKVQSRHLELHGLCNDCLLE